MKFYISEETGSVIWHVGGVPQFTPILEGGYFDTDDAMDPDFELVGDEKVLGDLTIKQLYAGVFERTDN